MPSTAARTKRGRPPKFDRPSQVVALTLPSDVVRGLKQTNDDIAWAIVTLFEKGRPAANRDGGAPPEPDAALVSVSPGVSLIVVDPAAIVGLPGIETIPIGENRAFLALDEGRGLADLELAIVDRLEHDNLPRAEATMLRRLRDTLRGWRGDPSLSFQTRAIIVVHQRRKRRRAASKNR